MSNTFTSFFVTSTPTISSMKVKHLSEEIMDPELDQKNQLIALKNEYQFKIDDLEALLDNEFKDKKRIQRQLSDQMSTLEELRRIRDNSVELTAFESLNDKFECLSSECLGLRKTIESLNKSLSSEENRNEELLIQIDSKEKEINKLKTSLGECVHKIKEQMNQINSFIDSNKKISYLENQLERERADNSRFKELLNVCKEEHLKHNESNISVDDINQSISNYMNSKGESLDCVVDIKLSELQLALKDKDCQLLKANEELIEMHSVVDKRLKKYKENFIQNRESLIAEQQKSDRLEYDLKNQINQNKQMSHKNKVLLNKLESKEEEIKSLKKSLSQTELKIQELNQMSFSFNKSSSIRLPSGTGNRFIMAEEQGEFMDATHSLLKHSESSMDISSIDEKRMSILQSRNSMVLPHLRTSYAVELPFMKEDVKPEDIREGFTSNDSLVFKSIQNLSFHRKRGKSNTSLI